MTSNFIKKVLGAALLGLTLLVGVGMTGTTALAQNQDEQYRRDDRNRRDDQYRRDQDRDRDNRDQDRDRRDNGRRGRGRSGDSYPNWGGSFQFRQTALNAGYNEGIKQGRDDLRHRRRYDFQRQGAYQKATKDYNSRDGDRELYRRYFREAYQTGYRDGFDGN